MAGIATPFLPHDKHLAKFWSADFYKYFHKMDIFLLFLFVLIVLVVEVVFVVSLSHSPPLVLVELSSFGSKNMRKPVRKTATAYFSSKIFEHGK